MKHHQDQLHLNEAKAKNFCPIIFSMESFPQNKMLAVTWHSRETKLSKKPSILISLV